MGNKKHKNGIIDEELMQRIDNMNDKAEFSPYQATKKRTIKEEQLFGEGLYENTEDDKGGNEEETSGTAKIVSTIVVIGILAVLAGVIVFVFKTMG